MSEKITLIHHSADFDGLFCREIARKFLPDAELIGWDFGDPPIYPITEGLVYILDLPVDRVFGCEFKDKKDGLPQCVWMAQPDMLQRAAAFDEMLKSIIWIDHHKSSIESHSEKITGYRIDGVAACRLAWQWFTLTPDIGGANPMPTKGEFESRIVKEPYAVRLAGEYDIWDKRDPNADVFQFGLRSKELTDWDWKQLLDNTVDKIVQGTGMESTNSELFCTHLLHNGALLQRYQQQTDASVVKHKSFQVVFEEMDFLCLNTPRCNSLTFAELDKPETGHSGLLAFFWDGKQWKVSLYHASHRKDIDLSQIAVKYGGGGHRGACGFQTKTLPFLNG